MPELVGLSVADSPCSISNGGLRKVWLIDCTRIDIVVTQGVLKDEVTDYTIENLDDLVPMEFTKNKTAFFNQVQASKHSAVDYNLLIPYEVLTPESIYVVNTMNTTCCFAAFIQLNNGIILYCGHDYDHDTDTISPIDDPLQLKGTINSGTGNNDKVTTTLEFIGQGKTFCLSTSLESTDLDDTTGHD